MKLLNGDREYFTYGNCVINWKFHGLYCRYSLSITYSNAQDLIRNRKCSTFPMCCSASQIQFPFDRAFFYSLFYRRFVVAVPVCSTIIFFINICIFCNVYAHHKSDAKHKKHNRRRATKVFLECVRFFQALQFSTTSTTITTTLSFDERRKIKRLKKNMNNK